MFSARKLLKHGVWRSKFPRLPPTTLICCFLLGSPFLYYIPHLYISPKQSWKRAVVPSVNSGRTRLAWNTRTKCKCTSFASSSYRLEHIPPFSRGESPLLHLVMNWNTYISLINYSLLSRNGNNVYIFNIDTFDQNKLEECTSRSFWEESGLSLIENRNCLGHLSQS